MEININELVKELSELFEKENLYYDIWSEGDDEIIADIDGDWKHDHAYFNHKVNEFFRNKGIFISIAEQEAEDEDGEDDWYHSYHIIKLMGEDKPFKDIIENHKAVKEDVEEEEKLVLDEPEDDEFVNVADVVDDLPKINYDDPMEQETLASTLNSEIANMYNDIDALKTIMVSFTSLTDEQKEIIQEIIDDRHYDIGRITSIVAKITPSDAAQIHQGMIDAENKIADGEELEEPEDVQEVPEEVPEEEESVEDIVIED